MPVFWLEEAQWLGPVVRPTLLTVPPRLHLKGESNSPKGNYGSVTRGRRRDAEWLKVKCPLL